MPYVFIFLVLSRNPNSLNSFCWSSFLMPTPVSTTEIWRYWFWTKFRFCSYSWSIESSAWMFPNFGGSSVIFTLIVTLPLWVNFKAFDYKLSKIYCILFSSDMTIGLYADTSNWLAPCLSSSSSAILSYSTVKSIPADKAFFLWIHITFSIAFRMLKLCTFFLNFPALIYA